MNLTLSKTFDRFMDGIKRLMLAITGKPRATSQYINTPPDEQNILDLFEGLWACQLPPPYDELHAGDSPLFNDGRIHWGGKLIGGYTGKRVLELGPLEAAHTTMIERAGADEIIAVEANTTAFLKCLAIKEIFNLQRSRFLLGDFIGYLENTDAQFDVCVASGVLYHMAEPIKLLHLIAQHAETVLLWTHYYDAQIIESTPSLARKFTHLGEREDYGIRYAVHKQTYGETVTGTRFFGGNKPYSLWLERETILTALEQFGYTDITIGFDEPNQVHGPAFALLARKHIE